MVSSRIASWKRSLAAALVICLSLQPLVAAQEQAMELPVHPEPLVAETDEGERSFTIEIADDPGERSRGLMFRQDMDDDHGMLFVFEQSQPVGFWMKNTPLPLDLVFIGEDGKVRAIERGEPFSEAPIAPGEPVQFVLELNAGAAAEAGIENGDLIRHPAISQAAGAN
ncbi:DUF192 domain-containing protein [Mesorhizobium sp. WSM2239]|uniref:DUF192 domain-containing protein n=2 Tax=unclassified Mesorhizobium TaxID=325217 RepID=A0AAU8D431_9HYPH